MTDFRVNVLVVRATGSIRREAIGGGFVGAP
jgi:hypothetical protein